MIDLLSNSSWIKPQIDYLLWLQSIRDFCPYIINKFFLSVTVIGEIWIPTLLCGIYYWCINTRNGLFLFLLFGCHYLFSQLIKVMACVYRPWILDNRVVPVKEAMTFAKSYSFPSGHSSMAASNLGGIAYLLKNKLWALFLILIIFMVGFSRMWLGVHTPQDVIAGFLIGFVLIVLGNYVINWVEKNKNRYMILLIIVNAIFAFALVYIVYFCKFPMDYIGGKLIVNPKGAIHTAIVCYGYSAGLINGALLCKRFFPFNPQDYSIKAKLFIGIFGSVIAIIILNTVLEYCFSSSIRYSYTFIIAYVIGLWITAIYPFIFSRINFLKRL